MSKFPVAEIKLNPVDSSNVKAIGLLPEHNIVAAQFKGGSDIYLYTGVPTEFFEIYALVESKGKFVNIIKKYPCIKLSQESLTESALFSHINEETSASVN